MLLNCGNEVLNMQPVLKNRKRFTSSLDNSLVPLLDKLSADTRIPKSRLLDEAIEDLLKKYGCLEDEKK